MLNISLGQRPELQPQPQRGRALDLLAERLRVGAQHLVDRQHLAAGGFMGGFHQWHPPLVGEFHP